MKVKYRNIAVSGAIGTGKSTLARNLAKKLGWKYLSAGEHVRKWHAEHNIPLAESDKVPEQMDRNIEASYKRMMEADSQKVFEAHLAGWHAKDLPGVFKVLCTAEDEVRMQRAAKRDGVTVEEATEEASRRAKSHQEKFKRLYGIDNRFNPKYFDLVVDTTKLTPEEVLNQVLEKMVE